MDENTELNLIINYFMSEKQIAMFTRSKYCVKFYGCGPLKYVQTERKIKLIIKGEEFLWEPTDENNKYLSFLPLERILEIEIEKIIYDSQKKEFIFYFINGDSMTLDDEYDEGIWPEYPYRFKYRLRNCSRRLKRFYHKLIGRPSKTIIALISLGVH
jgi:hypothetical protein